MKEINITWCYPDILNLHGDRGNLMALERISKELNIKPNITRIDRLKDKIDFKKTDILFFNAGETCVVKDIVSALNAQKKELTDFIESGKFVIVIGTTGAAFGKTFEYVNNDKIECLGYLDMECKERTEVYGNDLLFKLDEFDMEIVGSQIQIIDIDLNSDISLGQLEYGMGNDNKTEGARYKNLIFTNCLGPLFVKNPWFAEYIIKKSLNLKFSKLNKYKLEEQSLKSIKDFIKIKDV